jgi:hypothetical protein
MRLRDKTRIEAAVQRVGWWLDWGHMPGRRRREVLRELRAGLADAARAGELEGALARLGSARSMAEEYLAEERSGLRWRAGVMAAVLAYALVTWLVLAFMIGFAEGVQAVGPEVSHTYEVGRGLVVADRPLTAFWQTEEGFGASGSLLTWPHLVAMLAAFVAFARPWRTLRRHTTTADRAAA